MERVNADKQPVRGKFQELMLIRDRDGLVEFLSRDEINESDIQREWQQKAGCIGVGQLSEIFELRHRRRLRHHKIRSISEKIRKGS